ncbi:MAG: recombination protein RecR, partial [Paludibacteraceae bacterium]|nr:recombination protein RecR [Paludibacteraceae bacterium]
MNDEQYPSQLLQNAVDEFSKLPGIGRKTALRLVLNMLRRDKEDVSRFANSVLRLRNEVRYCSVCHNISDTETCQICSNPSRDGSIICVVETVKDVMSVENTQQYRGLYHVLGGVISPMDGIGPNDLEIESLVKRVSEGGINEVILALSPTMEGDTTNFFLFKKLSPLDVKITTIARGVAVGDELQYADEVT